MIWIRQTLFWTWDIFFVFCNKKPDCFLCVCAFTTMYHLRLQLSFIFQVCNENFHSSSCGFLVHDNQTKHTFLQGTSFFMSTDFMWQNCERSVGHIETSVTSVNATSPFMESALWKTTTTVNLKHATNTHTHAHNYKEPYLFLLATVQESFLIWFVSDSSVERIQDAITSLMWV